MKIIDRQDVVQKRYHVVVAASNIILCVIGIICILTVMFTWFQDYIRDEMIKMSYTQLSNTAQSVQSRLDYYQMQLQNLFQEPQIKASLYTNADGEMHEFDIYRFLNYSIVNDGVIDYAVIYKDDEIKQFIGAPYPGKEELDAVASFLGQSRNDREIYKYYNEKVTNSRIYICRTERDVLNGPPKRGLLFAINQKKFAKSLFGERDDAGPQNVWVFDPAGNIMLQQTDNAEEITEEVWELIRNETEDYATYEIEVDGENCFLVYQKEMDYQLRFVQMIDTREISATIGQMRFISLIGMAVILAVCSIAAFVLSDFVLYPLRSFIHNLTISAGLTGENGENGELTLLTSERILSEISSMSRQLHTDKVLAYLEDAVQEDTPPDIFELKARRQAAVLVYIGSKIGRIHNDQIGMLRSCIREMFPQGVTAELYPEENRCYGLLVLTEQADAEPYFLTDRIRLEKLLSQMFVHVSMSEGMLYAVYSERMFETERLQPEFRQMKERTKYVLFGDFEMISCSADYREKTDEEIAKKSFAEIIAAVKSGNDMQAKSLMPDILRMVSQYEIRRIFHALSHLAVEIEQVYYQFSNHAKDYQEAYLEHYIKLTSLVNQKELYDYFSNLIEDACLEIRTSGERSLRTTMLDSIRYIEEHYTDPDLSVDHIAEKFHISNSYFSRMFNEICGFSFPEYVNELRMNYAAQLLQTTNFSIKEIAARSGFSGVSYFGAQFKKKYGVSPSIYRGKQVSKT